LSPGPSAEPGLRHLRPYECHDRPKAKVHDGDETDERQKTREVVGPTRVDPSQQDRNGARAPLIAVDAGVDLLEGHWWEVEVRDDDLLAGNERRDHDVLAASRKCLYVMRKRLPDREVRHGPVMVKPDVGGGLTGSVAKDDGVRVDVACLPARWSEGERRDVTIERDQNRAVLQPTLPRSTDDEGDDRRCDGRHDLPVDVHRAAHLIAGLETITSHRAGLDPPRPPRYRAAVSPEKTTLLYILSTLAQTCAALAAFVGAIGLFRLQTVREQLRAAQRTLRENAANAGIVHRGLEFRVPFREVVKAAEEMPTTRPANSPWQAMIREDLARWQRSVTRFQLAYVGLVLFETWNLLLIAVSLIGFNYVQVLGLVTLDVLGRR